MSESEEKCNALCKQLEESWCNNLDGQTIRMSLENVFIASGERGVEPNKLIRYVVKKHLDQEQWKKVPMENFSAKDSHDFKVFSIECISTLHLVCNVQTTFNGVLKIIKMFVPHKLDITVDGKTEKFLFSDFDDEGRTIYLQDGADESSRSYVRWHQAEGKGGRWSYKTDSMGKHKGEWQLDSALVTDKGRWERMDSDGSSSSSLKLVPSDPVVPKSKVEELRDIQIVRTESGLHFQPGVKEATDDLRRILENLFAYTDETFTNQCHKLLCALCDVAKRLEMKIPGRRFGNLAYVKHPKSAGIEDLVHTLVWLAKLADEEVLKKLGMNLPKFTDKEDLKKDLITQMFILNCRLLDISDMRATGESFLARVFHRFSLWSWQEMHPQQVMLLDLQDNSGSLEEGKAFSLREGVRVRPPGEDQVRFVVVSDTHGWDEDLQLPEGDVLLHCGDLLFESGHLDSNGDIPSDLEAKLGLFDTPTYASFQWIIICCGNHDQSIYDLWSREEERLCEKLPQNVVLLQAYTDLNDGGQKLPSSGLAKSKEIRNCVQDGALWLEPQRGEDNRARLKIGRPDDKKDGPGWIIAGSGVSLANNYWSANRAFQLVRPSDDKDQARIGKLEEAAKALTKHNPDIIMSHGPPKAYTDKKEKKWDEGKGDEQLRKELDRCQSWKIALFGHAHSLHGLVHKQDGKRPFVNAAISTPLYVPSRPPIAFDLQVPTDAVQSVRGEASTPLLAASGGGQGKTPRHRRVPFDESKGMCESCVTLRCCWESKGGKDLLFNWIPRWFVAKQVQVILSKRRDEAEQEAVSAKQSEQSCEAKVVEDEDTMRKEARDKVVLSEFDVCGPAVLYSFQAILVWVASLLFCLVAYLTTGVKSTYLFSAPEDECFEMPPDRNCAALMPYPNWLVFCLLPVAYKMWKVQMKCLRYLIVPQVQLLGRGFKVMGIEVSFWWWYFVAFVTNCLATSEVATACIFYGQFLASVALNPKIQLVWEHDIQESWMAIIPGYSNITTVFTVCWSMLFVQAIYMVLHMFVDEDNGVSYDFGSMRKGYATYASHAFICGSPDTTPDANKNEDKVGAASKKNVVKFWHADILRVCAIYGRMPALVASEYDMTIARLHKELENHNAVRFLQILWTRAKDHLSRIILIDILEKALKLEIQVSLFAIDLALKPTEKNKYLSSTWQIAMPIALSTFSALVALYQHMAAWWTFSRLSTKPAATQGNFLNDASCKKNLSLIWGTLAVYLFFIVVFILFIGHSAIKFWKAFECEFSMWNWSGCVEFESDTVHGSRQLIF